MTIILFLVIKSHASEDSKNNIWVGTELGVSIFDIESRTFSRPINPNDIDNEILDDSLPQSLEKTVMLMQVHIVLEKQVQ